MPEQAKKKADPKKAVATPKVESAKDTSAKPQTTKTSTIPTCGFLAWWEFHGLKVKPVDLQAIVDKHSYELKVPEISKYSALLESIRDYRFGDNKTRYKAELAHQDDDFVTINILERKKVAQKKVEWHHVDTIVWEKANKDFLSKGSSQEESIMKACDRLISDYDENSTYLDHGYVRPHILQKSFSDMNAVSLRSRGGMYFVDQSKKASIEKLNALCDDISGVILCTCTMQADHKTKKSIAGQVRSSFSERLKELEAKTSEWKKRTRNLRTDTMTNTLSEFADIKNQLEIYQQSLSMKSDDLLKELSDLEQIANDLILDQGNRERGVSGAVVKRWKKIMELHTPTSNGDYEIPVDFLKNMALPDCCFDPNFYKASRNSSGYRAITHLGYLPCLADDVLTLSKL